MKTETATTDPLSPDVRYMRMALQLARQAAEQDEVPVGAVIVRDGELLAKSANQVETLKDPTAHAEILAITQACVAVGDWRLNGCVMYVSKEPCPMCAGALVLARIDRVVWGLSDPRRGGGGSCFPILQHENLNHRVEITRDFMQDEAAEIMQSFFRRRRQENKAQRAD